MVSIHADMVANVLAVRVHDGALVNRGDTIATVESMKMEIPVRSPVSGTVASVCVSVGDIVSEGDLLAVVEPEELQVAEGATEPANGLAEEPRGS